VSVPLWGDEEPQSEWFGSFGVGTPNTLTGGSHGRPNRENR
jgi:hypothetical protein